MSNCFEYKHGSLPLLISIPHDGRELPGSIARQMTAEGFAMPDTDWHVNRLYEFARKLGACVISANYSRYVVDLNRSAEDTALYQGQLSTGLCPEQTFAGDEIYKPGTVISAEEKRERIENYWQPYHDKLALMLQRIKSAHGFALLWDAHSIPGKVPLLFPGQLPDLNIGTNDSRSCATDVESAVAEVANGCVFSSVVNGRFRGGYITRHYGAPADNIHAIQLELAQHCYMDETSLLYDERRASVLAASIEEMLQAFIATATAAT